MKLPQQECDDSVLGVLVNAIRKKRRGQGCSESSNQSKKLTLLPGAELVDSFRGTGIRLDTEVEGRHFRHFSDFPHRVLHNGYP
jgi:hypothetical protein